MSHGIVELNRDFVYGLQGQGKDWHGLTQERPAITRELFPVMVPSRLVTETGFKTPWHVLLANDDGQPCGGPFNPQSFGYILPQKAWDMVMDALGGTHFTVERCGMLWDRSFWFVSVALEELKAITRKGEKFQLNFSGGLDGNNSPQGELSHIRAVCWNTISASRNTGEYLFKIRQTKNSKVRLDAAKEDVEKAVGMAAIFNKTLASLEATSATVDVARLAYAGDVARHGGDFRIKVSDKTGEAKENRSRNTVDELVSLFESGDGNTASTRADILNGYTQFFTRGRADSKKNPWAMVATSEFGGNADRKAAFLDCLTDEADFAALCEEGDKALATK